MKSIARPRQLLSTIFALDASYNKRVLVGLEYENIFDPNSYKPVVRLSTSRFEGVDFDCHSWQEFKEVIPKISKFYSGESSSFIERIEGSGWTATLRRRWRLIDITVSDATMVKKRRSIVTFTKSDFDCMVNAVKCIDDKIQYLYAIKNCVSKTVYEYYCILKKDVELNNDGQITWYTKPLIEEINDRIKDTIVSDIASKIGINKLNVTNIPYNHNDIVIVLHEIVAFHVDQIVEILNYEAMHLDYLKSGEREILL